MEVRIAIQLVQGGMAEMVSYVFSYTPSLDLVIEGELFKGGNGGGAVENFDLSYEYNSVQRVI